MLANWLSQTGVMVDAAKACALFGVSLLLCASLCAGQTGEQFLPDDVQVYFPSTVSDSAFGE